MEFSERVKSLTQDYLLPKVVDEVLGSNVMALRLIGNARQGKGETIKKAIKFQSAGTATSFAGLDTFAAALQSTKVRMAFDMRGVRNTVALSGMEVTANGVSETQVTDLVKDSLEEAETELIDEIGTQLYGLGTGNNNKDLLGIGGIVDDTTDTSTIGGLSKSTYPVLSATRTASGGTMTLAKLATLYSAISSGTSRTTPTIMVSNETVWDLYEQLLTPTVRETYSQMGYYDMGIKGAAKRGEGLVGMHGFTAVSYKGIGWVRDEKATAQNVFMLNEEWLQYYGWEAAPVTGYKKISIGSEALESIYDEAPMSSFTGFNWSGFNNPTNQFGSIADIILLGNLTSWQPRRQGRLTGVTGV